MNRRLKLICLIVPLALCFGLVPNAKATDTDGALPFGNNADGVGVLTSLTTGAWNSGFGFEALNHNTIGSLNTATGLRALFNNTEGDANTANGVMALFSNTTGDGNVAIGAQTLVFNTDGFDNTAVGTQALSSNTSNNNTATGFKALFNNATGSENTANGGGALFSNTIGRFNTANGLLALSSNTEGDDNTAVGAGALGGNTTGSENIALGVSAGANLTTGDNNIDIGNFVSGNPAESNTIRIGRSDFQTATFIAGISGATVPGGVTVIVDANGHLGTVVSSQRFKDEIKPMDKASEAIHALKPVTFRYKQELDPEGMPQFGLVAEEVAKVNPALVARDAKGQVYTVRYEAVNAMLLNEFLKEHKKVEAQNRRIQEQETTITQLKKEVETVVARLKEQDSKIQAVSDQVELSKERPKVVVSDQ